MIGSFTAVGKAAQAVRWAPVGHRLVDRADRVASAWEGPADQAVLVDQVALAVPAVGASLAAVLAAPVDAVDLAPGQEATAAPHLEMPAGDAGSSTETSPWSWIIPRWMPNRFRSPVRKHPKPLTIISAPPALSAAL